MEDKLQLLLNQINISNQENFKEGSLNKIICNKAKDKYVFCLSLNKPLPIQTYEELNHNLKKRFSTAKSIKVQITAKKNDIQLLTCYYKYFLEKYSQEAPLLKMFINTPLKLDDDNLLIDLTNKAEEMKFKSIKEPL